MMKSKNYIISCLNIAVFVLVACALTACNKKSDDAEKLLEEIRSAYNSGNYKAALRGVDSLRHAYPDEVKARTEALELYQKASLGIAQSKLSIVDSALMVAQGEYDALRPVVEKRHKEGIATAQELDHLNKLRVHRDSLQVSFNVECARIKYIMKRMRENGSEIPAIK